MATYSSILARDIPWIEERSGLQSTGSQRVRHFLVIKSSSNNIYVCMHGKSLQSHQTLRRQRPWPARLLCPWDFPGKNTGVGCPFLQGDLPDPGIEPISPVNNNNISFPFTCKHERRSHTNKQMGFLGG